MHRSRVAQDIAEAGVSEPKLHQPVQSHVSTNMLWDLVDNVKSAHKSAPGAATWRHSVLLERTTDVVRAGQFKGMWTIRKLRQRTQWVAQRSLKPECLLACILR